MVYKVVYAKGVVKDLKKLPREVKERILHFIETQLIHQPFEGKALKGVYQGLYRYRISNYRLIYTINHDQLKIIVLRVRHRKTAYRGKISVRKDTGVEDQKGVYRKRAQTELDPAIINQIKYHIQQLEKLTHQI